VTRSKSPRESVEVMAYREGAARRGLRVRINGDPLGAVAKVGK